MAHSDKPTNADALLAKHQATQQSARVKVPAKQTENDLTPIEQWAQSIINDDIPNKDPNTTDNLSRYGLQNSKDVITFLRSPEGKSLLAEINEQMALEKARRDQQQTARLESERLKHFLLAACSLWIMEEKSAEAHQQKDYILKQTEKGIKESGKSATPTPQSAESQQLAKAIANFDKALEVNQRFIAHVTQENEALKQQLVQLGQERVALVQVHQNQVNAVNNFNAFIADPQNEEQVIQRIAEYTDEMERNNRAIIALVDKDKDAEAREIIARNEELNLLLGINNDMLSVQSGKKQFVDLNGQRVDSPAQAHYVLPIEMLLLQARIVKDGQQYFVLRPGEDLSSTEVRKEAAKRFKPNMLSVGALIENNLGMRIEINDAKVVTISRVVKANEATLAQAQAHNDEIQINRDVAQAEQMRLQGITPPAPAPRPSPTASIGHFSAPTPKPAAVNGYYRKYLELRQKENPTIEDVRTLASLVPETLQNEVKAYLASAKINLNDPRNTPIGFQKMQTILRNMPYMGIDPTSSAVSNLKSALVLAKEATVARVQPEPTPIAEDHEQRSKTAPNPLEIDPSKRG